jgi:ComF family protein
VRQKLLSITQSLCLPSICSLCRQFHKSNLAVCAPCIEFLKPLETTCQHCAYPLADDNYLVCGQCIKNPPHFSKAIIAYVFEEPLRSLMHQFKYNNGLYLGAFFSHLMLHAFKKQAIKPDCLIPVPMHPKRLKQRGFNQAAVLTQLLARILQLPYDLSSCKKILNTAPQANLNGEERKKNLHNAFYTAPLPYEHVVVVDDLMTTGNTANELARTLKKSGVKTVDIWCCARTVSDS